MIGPHGERATVRLCVGTLHTCLGVLVVALAAVAPLGAIVPRLQGVARAARAWRLGASRRRGLVDAAEHASFDAQGIVERRSAIHDVNESRAGAHLLEETVRLHGSQWFNGSKHGDNCAPIGVHHSPARPARDSPPKA